MISRAALRPLLRSPVAVHKFSPLAIPRRCYASGTEPEAAASKRDTSTSNPTVPHAPPKPTPFFAWKNIGLEVTPLMAFIGTIAIVATGALVRNLLTDPDIHSRHGVENDDKLQKVLAMPDDAGKKTEGGEKTETKK